MELVIYAIPFITALLLLIVFHRKMVWWEYAVLIIPSLLFVFLTRIIMVSVNASDTEYLGSYVKQITYYEEWDEMVWVTKTRRVPCGVDSNGHTKYRTETYTVRERRYHPERWVYVDSESNREHMISKGEFDKIQRRFNTKPLFRDMKRNYHRIDGDAYDTYWDKSVIHLYEITTPKKYKNKIKARETHTIFRMKDISDEEATKLGLYNYPKINDLTQPPIIGKPVSDREMQRIKYINATYGKLWQFRCYVLLFNDKDIEISERQKAFWQNGNKNEFVVCLGIKGDSVVWSNPFSWCDEPKLEVLTRDYFVQNPKLDLDEYGKWLQTQIPTKWKRKEFEDFDYINVGLSSTQYIALVILTVVINICISIWLVVNDIEN